MISITKSNYFKNSLLIMFSFGFLCSTSNIVYSDSSKTNHITENDFLRSLNQNSVNFYQYENSGNLFDDFFGLNDPLNETSSKINFQDLSLQIDSKNVRDLYIEKLLEMTKKTKSNKNEWSFFTKKI